MRTLTTFVYVNDDEGMAHSFGPGDIVPEWAEALITNPDVWSDSAAAHPTRGGDQGEGGQGEPPTLTSPHHELDDGEFGYGPWRGRSAADVRGLADALNMENNNKDEAIAALEAEGIEPNMGVSDD